MSRMTVIQAVFEAGFFSNEIVDLISSYSKADVQNALDDFLSVYPEEALEGDMTEIVMADIQNCKPVTDLGKLFWAHTGLREQAKIDADMEADYEPIPL